MEDFCKALEQKFNTFAEQQRLLCQNLQADLDEKGKQITKLEESVRSLKKELAQEIERRKLLESYLKPETSESESDKENFSITAFASIVMPR